MTLRCLTATPETYQGDAVLCGVLTRTRRFENAGRAFHTTFENRNAAKQDQNKKPKVVSPEDSNDDAEEDERWGEKHKSDKRTKGTGAPTKLKKLIEGPNLYEVLGLNDSCSMDAIRKAYRRLALEYHPDKKTHKNRLAKSESLTTLAGDEDSTPESRCSTPNNIKTTRLKRPKGTSRLTDDEMFLLIQDAYETLNDSNLRHQYDSALPFDESIPSVNDLQEDDIHSFFNVFEPVFNRNARWSGKKPVPKLGGITSLIRDVHRFYSFWWNFETTRDFAVNDEFDTADAECREERRWMERQNLKMRKKYIKEEKERLNKLTDLAFSLDPRIRAEKAEQKRKKEDAKEAKRKEAEAKLEAERAKEQKKRQEEEAKKKAEADQQRKQTEVRQKAKAELKRNRQRIREIFNPLVAIGHLHADDLHEFCIGTPVEQLESLATEFEKLKADDNGETKVMERFQELTQKIHEQEETPSMHFRNTTIKYTEKVQDSSPKKSVEWTADELSALAKGLQKYPGGTARRWFHISQLIGTKSENQVIEKTKEMADGNSLKSMGSKLSQQAFNQYIKDNSGVLKKIDVSADERDFETEPREVQNEEPVQNNILSTTSATGSLWTTEHQKSFEQALKSHPPSMQPKERWMAIASDVPGKTPKECLARFKEIRSAIMKTR